MAIVRNRKYFSFRLQVRKRTPNTIWYYVESKIWHKWTYLQNRNRLTETTDLWVPGEFGISRCRLLYIGWINNKVLLYSTGNYIQYRVITHNGKEYLKNRMSRDFPGHPVVKTLPFPAVGAGLIPGELRSHMLWGITKIFLKKKNVYVSNWVTSLYSRDWHNIVNQLYFN